MGSGLEGGPCVINMDNDAATICDQLCLFVSKIIDESVIMMTPLLKLDGVEEKYISPFYKRFTLSKDLLDAYITYCPKTFSFDGMDGTTEVKNPMKVMTATNNKPRKKPRT